MRALRSSKEQVSLVGDGVLRSSIVLFAHSDTALIRPKRRHSYTVERSDCRHFGPRSSLL